ncbi:AraC family transcriptional regulator [soil metagenome]
MKTNKVPPASKADFVRAFYEMLGDERGLAFFDALTDIRFFVKDTSSRFVHANRATLAAHELSSVDEIIGLTDHDLSPRHMADRFVEDDRRVFSGEIIRDHVELSLRQHGCPNWHSTTKVPLYARNGRIIGLAGVTRDLKQAAAATVTFTRLSPALDHISAQFSGPVSVADLAGVTRMSTRNFQRHFQQVFGMSPMDYLRQFRVGQAVRALVETDETIASIAQASGFSDHSHFTREFARVFGNSPGAYRKQYRKQAGEARPA